MLCKDRNVIKPDFLIVGAQKCGTSWFWSMLKQHPGIDLPIKKELHFFSKTCNYKNGLEWYYNFFNHLDPSKVTGEASTSYLYDRVKLNIHTELKHVRVDESLPTIPELIIRELPHIKIFILLRDPVKRAVSAYYHHINSCDVSPFLRIQDAIQQLPNRVIIELGQYAKYIKLWKEFVPSDRMRIYVFEEDVVRSPEETIRDAYSFLNLNTDFMPSKYNKPVHKGIDWPHLLINYYVSLILNKINNERILKQIKKRIGQIQIPKSIDNALCKIQPQINKNDIEFLRSVYLPEKAELEQVIGRSLDCWKYEYVNK